MTAAVVREAQAQAFGAIALWASLHAGAPGTAGDNQVGDRVAVTWSSGTEDGVITSSTVSFTLVDPADLTDVGFWTDETAGTFLDSAPNVVSVAAGTYEVSLIYTVPDAA